MPLSPIEERLAAIGLERNPDVQTLVKILRFVRAMRRYQKDYFRTGTRADLRAAKDWEKKVDDMIAPENPGQEGLGL